MIRFAVFSIAVLLAVSAHDHQNFKNNFDSPKRGQSHHEKEVTDNEANLFDGSCSSCKMVMRAFDSFFTSDTVVSKIDSWAIDVCLKYLSYGEEVCTDMVNRMAPIIIDVVANSYLEANYFCVEMVELCDKPTFTYYPAQEYVDAMLATKPEETLANDFVDNLYAQMKASKAAGEERRVLTAVLMSDIHLDYEQELTEEEYFGHIGSETSQRTLEACLKFMAEELKPDFLFWTGDNSKSDTWSNELDQVVFYTRNLSDSIRAAGLDQLAGVYPIEGNHDVYPVNVQEFGEPGTNEAINGFKSAWEDWFTAEEFAVFEKYGYYSKDLMTAQGETFGTKVIGMNTMGCNYFNWYLIEERYDPGQQLEFLVNELDQLEKEGGKAILISHIPIPECVHEWGARFRAIVERYQHVIRFQLYGHRHRVMYEVVQSFDNKPINLDYLTGSMAMQPSAEPSFTLIELQIDAELMIPINFKVYVMDLEASNAKKEGIFRLQNDHLETYELEDVSPSSMFGLSERILNEKEMAIKYLWNQYREYGEAPECDEICQRTWYCDTTAIEVLEYQECVKTMPDILGGAFFNILMNVLVSPWVQQD